MNRVKSPAETPTGTTAALGTAALLAAFCSALVLFTAVVGCDRHNENTHPAPQRILPPVVRFASSPVKKRTGDATDRLFNTGHKIFNFNKELLLDETFIDIGTWGTADGTKADPAAFRTIEHNGCSSKSALCLRRGIPNIGRIVDLPFRKPLTACARMKLPNGAKLDRYKDLLAIVELKRPAKLGISAAVPANFIKVHCNWKTAGSSDGWLNLYQVFVPGEGKEKTLSLAVGFNPSCTALKNGSDVLVDRIMIRTATLQETASAILLEAAQESGKEIVPCIRFDAGGELRDALVCSGTGGIELLIEPGKERVFRFAMALPAAGSRGHGRTAEWTVELLTESGTTPLFRERVDIGEPSAFYSCWREGRATIPPLDEKASLLLIGSCTGTGDALFAWGSPTLAQPVKKNAPPNIILVSIDTLRADKLGAYGGSHPAGVSPFIDSMANESILFEKAITQASYTLPAHVSLFSGQYPSVHKVIKVKNRINPERSPLLASVLAKAGYLTAAYTGGILVHHSFGFDEGFDTYFDCEPLRHGNYSRTLNWLNAGKNLPFFLFFHTYSVHHYGFNDKEYIKRFETESDSELRDFKNAGEWTEWLKNLEGATDADRTCLNNRYMAGIRIADDGIKRLVEDLKSMNMMKNTMLIITSDHGEEILDRGCIDHGHSVYEELVHIPLIIRPPGGVAGHKVPDIVELIDVAPTILEFLGIPVPEDIQGISLCRLFEPAAGRYGGGFGVAFSEIDYLANKYTLRAGDWKIIYTPGNGSGKETGDIEYEFYDLASDPGEKTNLVYSSSRFEDFQRTLAEFRKKLESISGSLIPLEEKTNVMDPELMEELKAQGYVR